MLPTNTRESNPWLTEYCNSQDVFVEANAELSNNGITSRSPKSDYFFCTSIGTHKIVCKDLLSFFYYVGNRVRYIATYSIRQLRTI